jgi:ribonuclease D
MVHTETDAAELRDSLAKASWVAVDTEFHAERVYTPVLMLVQVCVPGDRAWILDPLIPGLLHSVADALVRPGWIVHAGQWDLRLIREAVGRSPSRVRDTQVAAGLLGPRYPEGLATCADIWLGASLPKGEALSDWGRRPLQPSQIAYAARDVTVLPELWDRLEQRSAELGRAHLLDAASMDVAREALAPVDDADAWLDLAAADELSREEAAAVRALAAWREAKARARDVPPRVVLADGALVAIARGRWEQGRLGRPLDKALLREALEAAATGRATPPDAWPTPLTPGSEARVRHAAWCALAAISARDAGVAARLLWPDALVRNLALRDGPTVDEARAALGWRAAIVGEAVAGWLDGTTGLSMAGGRTASEARITRGSR